MTVLLKDIIAVKQVAQIKQLEQQPKTRLTHLLSDLGYSEICTLTIFPFCIANCIHEYMTLH